MQFFKLALLQCALASRLSNKLQVSSEKSLTKKIVFASISYDNSKSYSNDDIEQLLNHHRVQILITRGVRQVDFLPLWQKFYQTGGGLTVYSTLPIRGGYNFETSPTTTVDNSSNMILEIPCHDEDGKHVSIFCADDHITSTHHQDFYKFFNIYGADYYNIMATKNDIYSIQDSSVSFNGYTVSATESNPKIQIATMRFNKVN